MRIQLEQPAVQQATVAMQGRHHPVQRPVQQPTEGLWQVPDSNSVPGGQRHAQGSKRPDGRRELEDLVLHLLQTGPPGQPVDAVQHGAVGNRRAQAVLRHPGQRLRHGALQGKLHLLHGASRVGQRPDVEQIGHDAQARAARLTVDRHAVGPAQDAQHPAVQARAVGQARRCGVRTRPGLAQQGLLLQQSMVFHQIVC